MGYLTRALSRLRRERTQPATEPWVEDRLKGVSGNGGGGATDLSYDPGSRTIFSSTGLDTQLPLVDGTNAGLMASADKTKLDGLPAAATIFSRANHTGTQLAATISDFASAALAAVASALSGKQNVILAGEAIVTPNRKVFDWRETVAAPGVTAGNRITVNLGSHLDTDENDPELLDIRALGAVAGTDTITFILAFAIPARGPIKLNWSAL